MTRTVSRTDAQVLASLIMEDIRGYAARHPEDYAAYLQEKREREQQQAEVTPIKRRNRRSA